MTAECDPRAHQPGLRSGLCDADRICRIDERGFVLVIALHNQAKIRRKPLHCLGYSVVGLPLRVDLFGIGHGVGYLQDFDLLSLRCNDFESGFWMVPSLSQEHQRTVRCDCHDPGTKAAFGAKSGQMDERANQRVLKNVLCVFTIAKDLPYPTLERWSVAPA